MTSESKLSRNPHFRWLWLGHTVSVFGDQFSNLAIPVLAVTVLGATSQQMGYLAAAGTAKDPIEIKLLKGRLGQQQMAVMDGVERPAKNPHPLDMPGRTRGSCRNRSLRLLFHFSFCLFDFPAQ
jgi:hypothetical protein